MNTIRTLSAAACAAGIVALAPGAAQAAVTPGARYDEADALPGPSQFVRVSSDARKLSDYRLSAPGRCSDGKSFDADTELGKPRTITVDATGAFAVTQTEREAALDRGRKTYSGTLRNTITAQSSPDGTVITAKVVGSYVAKGLRCTTSGTTTLYRDGTPQAPLSNASMTTATYPGISGDGIAVRSFKALAPAGELRNFEIRGTVRCPDGRRVKTRSSYPMIFLSPRYTFSQSGGESSTFDPGYETETVSRVTLRMFKQGTAYGYRGTYAAKVTYTRKGRRGKPCTLPTVRFRQGLPSGPVPAN